MVTMIRGTRMSEKSHSEAIDSLKDLSDIADEFAGHPERTSSQEDIERSQERVKAAVEELDIIESFSKETSANPDGIVGDYIRDGGNDLVGVEYAYQHNGSANATLDALVDEPPLEVHDAAVDALSAGQSPSRIKGVLDRIIRRVKKNSSPEDEGIPIEELAKLKWEERTPGQNTLVLEAEFNAIFQSELEDKRADVVKLLRKELDEDEEDFARAKASVATSAKIYSTLMMIPPANLLAMRKNMGKEREVFDEILEPCYFDLPTYSRSALDARLSGFSSVKEKYEYQQKSGDIDRNTVSKSEIYAELYEIFARRAEESGDDTYLKQSVTHILTEEFGYDDEAANEVVMGMAGKVAVHLGESIEKSDMTVSSAKQYPELLKFFSAAESVGLDNVKKLREMCGIVNIGDLSPKQLERMVKFADGDPELLQELKNKEVCVVIKDATSDWNGALSGEFEKFETDQDATLAFEASLYEKTDDQVSGFVQMLKDRGIHASVLVIGGHGHPGSLRIGDSDLIPSLRDNNYKLGGNNTDLASIGLLELVSEMKPDRDGNCTVIYDSCSQDGEITHEDDTSLTRTANVIREAKTGKTYNLLGHTVPSNSTRNQNGDLVATASEQMRRIIVTSSGNIYRHMTKNGQIQIPMFERTGAQRQKVQDELEQVAASN